MPTDREVHRSSWKCPLSACTCLNSFFYNFIYLFLAALGLNCARAFSGCNEWGLLSSYSVWASHHRGFSCCGAQAPGAQAQYLWGMGLVTPWHLGSSYTRGWNPGLAGRLPTTGTPGSPQASLLDCIWGAWNARIPYPCGLESDSRPCKSFLPKSIFLRVDWSTSVIIPFTSSPMIWFPSHTFCFSWVSCGFRTSPSGKGRFHLNVLKFCR